MTRPLPTTGIGLHFFAFGDGHQRAAVFRIFFVDRVLAVDREPARIGHDLAFGLELMAGDFGDARRDLEFRCREEDRHETTRHEVVELLFGSDRFFGACGVGMIAK